MVPPRASGVRRAASVISPHSSPAGAAHIFGVASGTGVQVAHGLGAHEALDRERVHLEGAVEPVDLVFDTAGGDALARSRTLLREGGRLVSVAEEPPITERVKAVYSVVQPNRDQLVELALY